MTTGKNIAKSKLELIFCKDPCIYGDTHFHGQFDSHWETLMWKQHLTKERLPFVCIGYRCIWMGDRVISLTRFSPFKHRWRTKS